MKRLILTILCAGYFVSSYADKYKYFEVQAPHAAEYNMMSACLFDANEIKCEVITLHAMNREFAIRAIEPLKSSWALNAGIAIRGMKYYAGCNKDPNGYCLFKVSNDRFTLIAFNP